jgi:short subunit dehydrogenase-like uncharacterized protein
VPGRIVLVGAIGYTGRLTPKASVARGLSPVLAARTRERLQTLEDGSREAALPRV